MKLSCSPYELKYLKKYLSQSGAAGRKGALLRVQDDDGYYGYADLHQWPLNLSSIQGQLALQAAKMDLSYRRKNISIWNNYSNVKIENNYLLLNMADESTDADTILRNEIATAASSGFNFIKLKLGRNLLVEMNRLKSYIQDFPNLNWRLDFNSKLTFNQAKNFFSLLNQNEVSKIQYIEDPIPYENSGWSLLNKKIPLALDQAAAPMSCDEQAQAFEYIIIKPAIQDCAAIVDFALKKNKKIAITSFMDHPVGQAQSLAMALEIKKNLGASANDVLSVCGLRTGFLFESNEFSEQIENSGAYLLPPQGIGYGFDSQLGGLAWQNLN